MRVLGGEHLPGVEVGQQLTEQQRAVVRRYNNSELYAATVIAAAGRAMGMSYKRAWSLIEEMNAAFNAPLVTSARGGPGGAAETVETTLELQRAVDAKRIKAGETLNGQLFDFIH